MYLSRPNVQSRIPSIRTDSLFRNKNGSSGRWLRDIAYIEIPRGICSKPLVLSGQIDEAHEGCAEGIVGIHIRCNDFRCTVEKLGSFDVEIPLSYFRKTEVVRIELRLIGVRRTNFYAWAGRIFEKFLPDVQPYRDQLKNKRVRIMNLSVGEAELISFERLGGVLNYQLIEEYANIGINLVGWYDAALGIGESVRSAWKALQKSGIEVSAVKLKIPCLSQSIKENEDIDFSEYSLHQVNVFHIDPPVSKDLVHHHGKEFFRDKYNIGYWAWELSEFPDWWIPNFRFFNEIWVPSEFVRKAISAKCFLPVVTIPHVVNPIVPSAPDRSRFELPEDKFLFLFTYDLNSYQVRKNPQAVVDAFIKAFSDDFSKVGLVIKTHSVERNQESFEYLLKKIKDIPNVTILSDTLSREDLTLLQFSCDCFVSLHRSEGFGLNVAECMALGKPVISTDWSATSEFLNESNGYPVDYELIEITESIGPYERGNWWAEPSVEHASLHMRQVLDFPEEALRKGAQAKKDIEKKFSPEAVGVLYKKRLRAMNLWNVDLG